ncbi:hypothetical protein VE01_09052 [Pseudogymnoascus verrucosus]|uniref:Ubiquitin-conjugating enzyme E2C-binding protein n=1 Tax=Pseudogymnoascus verrucosus TaxID=342668 RepID=A0A1B8GAI6_9PEZI|nr:uncharacterized protein VE01_09052 [Pseudogymnoascus verrucosus]OBT92840.2 hypothetical protein VE01_09052 [Pseudogymnoascus verrucosus]
MMPSPPLIYAELLPNIRQISVLAALPTPSDGTTRVSLSGDRAILTLVHNGATASLQLPGAIAPTYNPAQPHPNLAQLSWRIPLAASLLQPRAAPSVTAPWSAGALAGTSSFSCRGCGQVILSPGRVTTWRDLPSENWAEMMEFWHCHKPDVPVGEKGDEEGGDNTTKGYGANTRMMAQKGVGKVDLTYFLLDGEDCSGLETNPSSLTLSCTSCAAHIGISTPAGNQLYKWSLSLTAPLTTATSSPTTQLAPTSPPLPHFLLPQLHAQSSALGVSKFIIRPPPPPADAKSESNADAEVGVYVWLFAPSLTVSFSSISSHPTSSSPALTPRNSSPPPPLPASKLLFRPSPPRDEATAVLDAPNSAVEEVRLPASVVRAFATLLQESNARLPEGARVFAGGWDVGILEVWNGGEGVV